MWEAANLPPLVEGKLKNLTERWRVLRRRTFYERLSRPVCQFCKPWHGFNGNSSRELRSAKRAPPPAPLSRPVEEESISSLPVIQINVISRLYSHPESRFHMSIYFQRTFFTVLFLKLCHHQFRRSVSLLLNRKSHTFHTIETSKCKKGENKWACEPNRM